MQTLKDLEYRIAELRSCGETIVRLADELGKVLLSLAPEKSLAVSSKEDQAEPPQPMKPITLGDVRHRLSILAQAGFAAEATSMITRHGVKRLSDLDSAIYGQILQESDEILHSENTSKF